MAVTPAPKKPRKKTTIDYKMVEVYSERHLSNEQICSLMSMKKRTFYQRLKDDEKFQNAILSGRARACSVAAATVLKDIQNDSDAAWKFLQKHSELWKPTPPQAVQVNHSGGIVNAQVDLSEVTLDDLTRMASTFLQTHGAPNATN